MGNKRRGRGEGYIEQIPSGSWRAVVSLGVNPATGRRMRLTATRKSKPAARAWLHDRLSERGRGELTAAGGHTVGSWCQKWLDQKADHLSARTHVNYACDIAKRIIPHLGKLPLAKLRRSMVADWYVAMKEAGDPPTARWKAGGTLSRALTDAVRQGILPSNPAALVRRPKLEPKPITVWTAEQVARFREHIQGHLWEALFVVALDTGMRRGELLALEWPEVWSSGEVLRVTHSIERGGRRKEVKTKQSRRCVRLSSVGCQAIATLGDRGAGPVFANRAGRVPEASVISTSFRRACKRAGVPVIRFHDLRHTHATLALAAGASIRAVSARLGHANPAFTLRVYAHAMPEDDGRIAEIWGGLLSPVDPAPVPRTA